jgi:hypothetical protein
MDAQKNPVLMGALIAIAGVAVGAGSVLFANPGSAYSGQNPNAAADMENPRELRGFTRGDVRRRDGGVLDASSGMEEGKHGAASTTMHDYTVDELIERCLDIGFSRTRLSHCIGEARNGVKYQANQTGL